MKSNSAIRAAARASLGHNIFSNNWIGGLIIAIIVGVVSGSSSFLIGLLLAGPVVLGSAFAYLSVVRGKETLEISSVMHGFDSNLFGRSIAIYLLYAIFICLWTLLFLIPGIVKSYSYRLAYFVALDHPEYGANECITESRRLMNGHKMQAFLLDLSFIGWIILGSCACGIGSLFVIPYMEASYAHFYQSVVDADAAFDA